MKIALIDPSLFTWPYDVKLVQGLASIGHDVTIYGSELPKPFTGTDTSFLKRHFYPGFANPAIQKLPKRAFLVLKGISHIESMIRLLWVLHRERPDVIHFQWTPLAVVDMRFIPLFRRIAPIVLTVHDSIPFNNKPSARLQYLGAVAIMKKFDQLIVHTAAARARLENYGIPADKINIVPHGLLLEPKESAPYAGGNGCVNLLMFGGIKPYKGVDILLRAIALLPEAARRSCCLHVVGEPCMPMEPLFDLVNSLGISEQVKFDLRFVPEGEVGTVMESADIQVFPYRDIDASGVLTLAIGVGRTIVASKLGVFDELLRDGIHGALVEPDDPQALAAALYPLIMDTAVRVRTAQAVKALANSISDWSDIARRTQEVYSRAKLNGATAKFRAAD